jgi:general stress protein 26
MKKVIKFKYEEKEGFLSVVEKSNHYYTLVQKDTPKVSDIKKTHKLLISYELKNPQFSEVVTHVIDDQDVIKWVYQTLEAEGNLYFKQLDDSLCALEIETNPEK